MESQLIKRTISPEIRAVEGEDRTYDFVISSETRDSYGTVFLIDGWDLTRYNANNVVAYNHHAFGPDPDTLIGTSTIRKEGKQLIARLVLEEGNPIAEKVKRKLDNGTLKGASVGAMPHEGRWGNRDAGEDPDTIYFTRSELMEWSVVSIPSNPDALKRSASEELVINSIPKPTKEKNSRADSRDEIRARISILQLN
jgi:HK97 family phage prohead protease